VVAKGSRPPRFEIDIVKRPYVFGKYAVVEWAKPDGYGRIVGKVIVGSQDVGLRQIEARHPKRIAHSA
jgi:endonuclease YncB( thermonuclease family)